ncbi:IS630 family transposase, partial [Sinorhizobium medicae]|nr:IS630 family transposase [Sinorhizobium medicae]
MEYPRRRRIGQRERSGRGLAPAKMGGHVKP